MPALTNYQRLFETSQRVNWRLENLLGEGRRLDFTRPFLPETFARTKPLGFLNTAEKLKLNRIRARGYLALFEWMSQGHYLGSVKDNQDLDPQFRSLLKHHWIEEAQHAKLDGLVLKSLAESSSPQDFATAIQEYFEIGSFLDAGFFQQAELDLESLERAIGRRLSQDKRRQFLDVQHGALRWTFLGSAMGNRNFLAVLASVSDEAAARVERAAKSFMLSWRAQPEVARIDSRQYGDR